MQWISPVNQETIKIVYNRNILSNLCVDTQSKHEYTTARTLTKEILDDIIV